MTAGEKQQLQKQQAVKYERENAGTRFKQKAVEEAEKREAQRKSFWNSRKKQRRISGVRLLNVPGRGKESVRKKFRNSKTSNRFFQIKPDAMPSAAPKKRLKMERVNRRRSKPISGVPVK